MMIFWIALGGGTGSVLRYLAQKQAHVLLGPQFPYGTLFVNVLGSFLFGYLAWVLVHRWPLDDDIRAGILVGLLGCFTTFSTFSNESLTLLMQGELSKVLVNVVFSVGLCIIAAALGLYLAKSV